MLTDFFDRPLDQRFGQIEILLGTMASAKSSLSLMMMSVFRNFKQSLNCEIDLFRPNKDTRPEISRLGIEKEREFTTVETAKEISDYVKEKTKFGKRRALFIDEVEFLDTETITTIQEITRDGNYVLLSGLAESFRGEPFPFSDYKKTMEDLLKIIPKQNQFFSPWAKCKTCRKTAEHTQRLINGEPAPYYDPLIRIDSDKSKAQADKKYSYEPRCKEHFYVPGKEEAKFTAYLLKQNQGITLTDITDLAKSTAKIQQDTTRQIIETMCAEKQAVIQDGKIYTPPIITIATQMP